MKSRLLLVPLCMLIVSASCKSTIHGSGELVEKEIKLKGFTAISAGNTFHVNVKHGPTYKVNVKIDKNLEKYLRITMHGNTLEIGMDCANQYDPSDEGMVLDIQTPRLENLDISGAAIASIRGFSNKSSSLSLSGASIISGEIHTENLFLDASGASLVQLTGSAKQMKIELSGASKAHLLDFKAAKAQINLSGASDAQVFVTDELSLDASGACNLEYAGKPKMKSISTSGASTVKAVEAKQITPEKPAD